MTKNLFFIGGGSRYEWNILYDGVQTWVEHFARLGLGMSGTLVIKGSRYEWNIEHKEVQVWVERFKIFKCFSCKLGSYPVKFDRWKLCAMKRILWCNQIRPEMNLISRKSFENLKAFHSYLAPIEQRSTHIWPPILLMFHSYLDQILQNVPLIPGPHLGKCSIHTWTTPIHKWTRE